MKDSVKKLGKEKAKVNDGKSALYDKEETRKQNTKRTVLSTCDCSTSKNYRKKGEKHMHQATRIASASLPCVAQLSSQGC